MTLKSLQPITAIARPVDPRVPTNLAITIIGILALIVGTLYQQTQGKPFTVAISWAISLAIGLFITWALARELDPEHDYAAFIGVACALIGYLWLGLPGYLPLFWLLLSLRMLNRTVGPPIGWLDSFAILGMGSWLAWQQGWWYAAITAVAFALDATLERPLYRHRIFAGISLLLTIITSVTIPTPDNGVPLANSGWGLLLPTILLFTLFTVRYDVQTAVGDQTKEGLHNGRIQAAQTIAILFTIITIWQQQSSSITTLMPLLTAMLGVSLYTITNIRQVSTLI